MVKEVTPDEVKERLGEEHVQIVDIRQPDDYAQGHIPGAINIPLDDLPRRIEEYDWEEEVVVACPIGQSSIQAARLIQSYEGVDDESEIASMAGGYEEWEYDLETDESEAPQAES